MHLLGPTDHRFRLDLELMPPRPDPIAEYQELAAQVRRLEGEKSATAAVLSTADANAFPAGRVVLVKRADAAGFVFYTNLESRKARELRQNSRAALCVYWAALDKQIRIEGVVESVVDEEADSYFSSRPRGSQLGAWASKQSEPLASRRELITRYLKVKARFAGRPIPRPPFWGGYRLVPERIEIWHNQLHRLHDRFLYRRTTDGWTVERLYP